MGSRFIGHSGYTTPPPASVVAGWASVWAYNFTTAPATTWTPAQAGTTQTVDGIDYVLGADFTAGNATIGTASGLRSSDTVITIGVRPNVDFTEATVGHTLGIVLACQDQGWQSSLLFGDSWASAWNFVRTGDPFWFQIQRRQAGVSFVDYVLADNLATGFLFLGTRSSTEMYYRTDVLDLDDLPNPSAAGWVYIGQVGKQFAAAWPCTGTNGRIQFWQNGTGSLELHAANVFNVPQ